MKTELPASEVCCILLIATTADDRFQVSQNKVMSPAEPLGSFSAEAVLEDSDFPNGCLVMNLGNSNMSSGKWSPSPRKILRLWKKKKKLYPVSLEQRDFKSPQKIAAARRH